MDDAIYDAGISLNAERAEPTAGDAEFLHLLGGKFLRGLASTGDGEDDEIGAWLHSIAHRISAREKAAAKELAELRAERDAIINSLIVESEPGRRRPFKAIIASNEPPDLFMHMDFFPSREVAVAAVRKAAGLDTAMAQQAGPDAGGGRSDGE